MSTSDEPELPGRLDLGEFKNLIRILDPEAATGIREHVIEDFVNTSHPNFQERIGLRRDFADGSCYTGYLWDYMRNASPVAEEQLWRLLSELDTVFVLWDIHSSERIRIPNYWKFSKDAVLKCAPAVLRAGAHLLPEDIYVTNEDRSWLAIFTHEEVNGQRWCLLSER